MLLELTEDELYLIFKVFKHMENVHLRQWMSCMTEDQIATSENKKQYLMTRMYGAVKNNVGWYIGKSKERETTGAFKRYRELFLDDFS